MPLQKEEALKIFFFKSSSQNDENLFSAGEIMRMEGFVIRECEACFLASIEKIVRDKNNKFPQDLIYTKDVESKRGVKEWLSNQLPSGYSYKPTVDQARLTNLIDIRAAQQKSRSFRRLCLTGEQIVKNR